MKKIIIVSDTHGNYRAIDRLLPIMLESDYVFHLGDHDGDIMRYYGKLKDKLYSVKGNCDGGGEDLILQIEDLKVMLTHGDRYRVKSSNMSLLYRAQELGVNVVFYGHTHCASIDTIQGVTLINPGCMTKFQPKSYCYAVVHKDKITAKIVDVNEYENL